MELASAIGQLRAQLTAAREAAVGEDLTFTVGRVEVELAVEARREGGAGGGVNFGVVAFDGKGTKTSGTTHKVTLELLPRGGDGRDVEVGHRTEGLPSR